MPRKNSAAKTVRAIRRKTRRNFSAKEKIRIVLEGLRGEESIASKEISQWVLEKPRRPAEDNGRDRCHAAFRRPNRARSTASQGRRHVYDDNDRDST